MIEGKYYGLCMNSGDEEIILNLAAILQDIRNIANANVNSKVIKNRFTWTEK